MKNIEGRPQGSPHYKSARGFLPVALCALSLIPATRMAAQFPAADTSRQQLKGHLTPQMKNAPVVGRVPPTTQLTLTVGLVIPNRAALIDAASQIADPNSPSYQKYLTPEEFADQFGATPADYQSVLDWAKANNLTVTPHRNRFAVTVVGSVADIEPALSVHLYNREREDGTEFFAPDAEPALKLAVPVEHVGGLDNFVRPVRAVGSGAGGAYQGTDFRNAYAPNMTLTGAGQSIGIFMLDGFSQSDINGYAAQTHQSFLPVQEVPANTPLTAGVEGTLDVEAALSMAPAAQVVVFVTTSNNRTAILTNMTDRPDIKQFSSSWFWYNGTTTDENLMLQLGTQGQSFFQATGDGGAYPVGIWPTCVSGQLDDRVFPSITLVGGTDLNMSNNGASYGSLETAWAGSSGGVETCVAIPSYQSHIAGHNGASSTHRNVPDVSAQANDILIYVNGGAGNVAGTSEATPLWAGYMALVNQLAANAGLRSVGFANPALYSIASTSAYSTDFHDVVSGCSPNSSAFQYCAGPGYDLATGLGTPQHALIYALSGVQSYPLYCQGPLVTTSGLTSFKWASQGAGAAKPGPGQCAWADRAPRGTEIKSGNSNVISGTLNQVASLPAGKFAEIGVYNSPNGHDMVVTQVVGLVSPPFSSSPVLP
jgi:subtilase family serine protease